MSEYRQISVEGRTILGKGGCGTVYRLDDDQVVKVYEKRISLPKIASRSRRRAMSIWGCPARTVTTSCGSGMPTA